ncbi:MAG: AraC family transcriptional regulator [Clostridia bacterium]
MPVSQIAYESGFGSSSYFIEKFRKNVGMTPAAFRKAGR